ncbi:MAG: hypothetical protein ACP5KA_03735 [Desulfurococcaceae archaeon]
MRLVERRGAGYCGLLLLQAARRRRSKRLYQLYSAALVELARASRGRSATTQRPRDQGARSRQRA